MMNQIADWLHWADSRGLFTFMAMTLLVVYRLIRPLIKEKLKTERNQGKLLALKITDELAAAIIPELAVIGNLDNEHRKQEAIHFINKRLKLLELSLTKETVSAKVEEAYQVYKGSQESKTRLEHKLKQ